MRIICKFAEKLTDMMKRFTLFFVFLAALMINGIDAMAQQQSYPEDMLNFDSPYCTHVKHKGATPSIVDFVTSIINDENMLMDSGDFIDAWSHYLRHEKQEPGTEIVVDKKSGYVCMTSVFTDDSDETTREVKSIYEMCYWNCADGKHKLFAVNFNGMENGRYYEGQTTGLGLYIYDNARRLMTDVIEESLGIDVENGIDQSYGKDDVDGLYHVLDHETREPVALNDEEFDRWLEERPVVTYWLPRKGKDIVAEIHYATKTDTVRLVWDGMRFNRQ